MNPGHTWPENRRLLDLLRHRYPDRRVPYGHFRALAEETGVHPRRIGRLAARAGYLSAERAARSARERRGLPLGARYGGAQGGKA